jgi:glycosyltransferase involved in cell wall biosynthesis
VLVPTAERDEAIGVSLFGALFRGVRAIMYNSLEERAMIAAAAQSHGVPGVVVGIGSEVPAAVEPERFRQKYGIDGPFAIYVGRIDENKGCAELFAHFRRYAAVRRRRPLTLVLVGNPVIPIPDYRFVRHLGFLDDRDKFDAMAASDLLLMPSRFESLSMVTLEAWALGRPVLANGACDVLKGQCIRSNAGLYYENEAEFVEALCALQDNPDLAARLGRNGREYFREHYAWPVIEGKYLEMLARLEREDAAGAARSIEPLPGWWARRRRMLPAARLVLSDLPAGPVVGTQETSAAC